MKEIVFDVETTTFQKGNPFSRRNKLCAVGIYDPWDDMWIEKIEYDAEPYGNKITNIVNQLNEAGVLIGFNIKFDLHWIRRYDPRFNRLGRVWDCQLGEYLLGNQSEPYPSLASSTGRYGIDGKLDIVRNEYWDKGYDTPEVPWDILSEYLEQDLRCTYELYKKQKELFENGDPRLYALFKAQCADLLVLADAEHNGLVFDTARAEELAAEGEAEILDIDNRLRAITGAGDWVNWNSGDHLSAILYGGRIYRKTRVPTQRVLKSGEIKHGEKWGTEPIEFRGMVRPLPRSETLPTNQWDDEGLAKINRGREAEGKRPYVRVYSTDEPTLKSLKPKSKRATEFIELILKRAGIEKLVSTYYRGIPELIHEKDWPAGRIHGQFNQCVAITGRLSSSGPNLQNFAKETKKLFYSRF